MDVAEHHCVKQNELDSKRTNNACCLHMWNLDFVRVYMCVCVETGGRGEGDGNERELCRGSRGPSKKTRGQGRAAGGKAQIETKKIINSICVCKCHKEAHLCVNFKN